MLCPAPRVAGSEPDDVTVNALFELVIPATWTGESPEFETETLVDAALPTFTSPKSTDDGVTTRDEELVDGEEKAFESDPQPDKPRLTAIAISARTPKKNRPYDCFLCESREETADISLASKDEKLRILSMRCHLIRSQSGVSVSRCGKIPRNLLRGTWPECIG